MPDLQRIAGYAEVYMSRVVVAPNYYYPTTTRKFNSSIPSSITLLSIAFIEGCERSSQGYASVCKSGVAVAPHHYPQQLPIIIQQPQLLIIILLLHYLLLGDETN